MRTFRTPANKPELLILNSKSLHQAGFMQVLETWADAVGLTLMEVVPDALLDTDHISASCEMIIVSVGDASIEDTAIKSLRGPILKIPLVIASDREDPQEICAAFKEGAVGFIPTSINPAVTFRALSFIKSGGSFFPPSALRSSCLREGIVKRLGANLNLTITQEEVLGLLRQGNPNKAIARQLGMSEATVKTHARSIMQKFRVTNRTQLAVAAMNQTSFRANDGR
jgi:DNA-binding NarL/FixJ family response regulator